MSAAAGGGVLDAMEDAAHALNCHPYARERDALLEARTAVAELIAADKGYDEADAQYTAAEQMYGEDSNHPEMSKARGRIIRAVKRRRAALSNIEGASHG